MKKNKRWLKFIVFIFIFFIFFVLINLNLRSESITKNWYQFRQIPKNSIDIFYAGNSRSYMTIQPQIIEDISGKSGYVLGVGGESLELTYFELKEMFETQSPKYIFLEVFPIYKFESGMTFTHQIVDFIDTMPFYEIDKELIWKFIQTQRFLDLIPIANYHAKIWKEPNFFSYNNFYFNQKNIIHKKPLVLDRYILNKGYINTYSQLSQSLINQYSNSSPIIQTTISKDTKELLQKIILLCEKNNAQLILWQIPQYTDFVDQNGIKINFQKVADENQIKFYDLNQYKFDILNYADINHVAPFGSQNVSLLLAEIIADHYVSEKNDYGLDQYNKISPIEYTYSSENQNFIITFTMASDKLDSQVVGTLEEQEIIYFGQIINNNQIQFILPQKPTSDYVNVTFENLQINRSISQYVYLNYTSIEQLP